MNQLILILSSLIKLISFTTILSRVIQLSSDTEYFHAHQVRRRWSERVHSLLE